MTIGFEEGSSHGRNLRPRHAWRWLAALLVSLVLHYWIYTVITPLTKAGRTSRQVQNSENQRIVVRMVQELGRPAARLEPDALPPEPPPNTVTSLASSRASASSPMGRESETPRFDTDIRFYTTEEVDQPAHPRLDWELPLDSIVAAGLRRLVIQVWILDNGKVFAVDIIAASPTVLGEQVRTNIVQGLMQTEIIPAIKDARRVASQRTLEIVIDL